LQIKKNKDRLKQEFATQKRERNRDAMLEERMVGKPPQNEDIGAKIKHKGPLTTTWNADGRGGDRRPGI